MSFLLSASLLSWWSFCSSCSSHPLFADLLVGDSGETVSRSPFLLLNDLVHVKYDLSTDSQGEATLFTEEVVVEVQKDCTDDVCVQECLHVVIVKEGGISLLNPPNHLFLVPSLHLLDCGDCR